MIHYARGIAFAALRRVPEAEAEREKFIDAVAAVPDSRFNSIPVPELQALAIARKMLDGELEYRKGNIEEAFSLLREAIALEDTLPYSDPPAWLQPVRHAYCALLTEQGRHAEAAEQHRIDLGLERKLGRRRIRPNNVWSLHGLYECLTKLGRHDEAREIVLQRDIAVASADIKIAAACFCRLSAFENEAA
jgi:tetratricopeptide (TPR) repeat protein